MTAAQAITARLLEVGDNLAFDASLRGPTADSLEWVDLRAQLANALPDDDGVRPE